MTVHPFIEESLLGDCLYNPDIIPEVAIALKEGAFFGLHTNQQLFAILFEIYAYHGNVSLPLLIDRLKQSSQLEQFGGIAALQTLTNNSLDPIAWHDHVEVIKHAALLREVDRTGDELKNIAGRGDLVKALDLAQRRIDEIRKIDGAKTAIQSFSQLAAIARERIRTARSKPDPVQGLRLPSMPRLERLLGGFKPGMGYMVYGNSSMGKSTLCVSIARDLVQQAPGLICTTEMEPIRWFFRLIGALVGISSRTIQDGGWIAPITGEFVPLSADQWTAIANAIQFLEEHNCHMLNIATPTIADLGTHLRNGIREYLYSWMIVDSASNVAHPNSDNIYWTTKSVGDGLMSLWRENNIPIIMSAQVKPEVTARANKIPRTEDAAGGATFGNNADVVLSLYNHHHYCELDPSLAPRPELPEGTILVRVTKHRDSEARNRGVVAQIVHGAGYYEAENQTGVSLKLF